ncbi:MAG: DUF1349 domain-containing protein [Clostridiales bacterium]|nr:DUF1349 domain-containing protein [Clostridiales bacterium]
MKDFKWINESRLEEKDGVLTIHAPAKTDFFNYGLALNAFGMPDESVSNAPYYYTEVEGDFVLRVKVSLEFMADYDACAILLLKDGLHWGKLCFEQSDFGTKAVVSVVTQVRSDDANGVNVTEKAIWLQAARVGNYFSFHYSRDGERFDMTRLFYMEAGQTLKVGLVAQSPIGDGGPRHFEHFTLERRTVKNLRQGK